MNQLSIIRIFKSKVQNTLGCIMGLCALIILNNMGYIELAHNEYVNPIYLLLCALYGGIFICSISIILNDVKYISSILCMVGKCTFSILALHFLCFKIINYIGVSFEGKPLCLIAAFPILYTGKYIWSAYTVVGLIIPILCRFMKGVLRTWIINKEFHEF